MKKHLRIFALLAAIAAASTFASCGDKGNSSSAGGTSAAGGAASQGSGAGTGADTSKKVNLLIYTFAGASPNDMQMVNDAASEITMNTLNCTVDVEVMADWSTRYKLALSAGEPIDLIWTAMWYSYQPYAFDGAWMDITSLVDEVVPELRDLIGQDVWDACKIDGKDFGIPSTNKSYSQWGAIWREDLRKKYGCPEIKDWETMESYAEAIKANEPGVIPFHDVANGGLFHSLSERSHSFIGLGNPQFSYGVGVDPATNELYIFHEADWFKEFLRTQKRWVDSGFVQPDVASSTDQTADGMLSGKYAGGLDMIPANALNSVIVPAREAHPDWEIGYMSYGEMFQWTYAESPISMCFALPKSCPNPERALLFARELMTNKELFQVYDMGVEGVHYEIDENGYYVSLNDPLNPGYLQGAGGVTSLLFNKDAKVYSEDYQWVLDYYENHMEPYLITNYFQNFPEDYSAYSDKVTAMSEINTQYTWPMLRGAVDDPEAALADVNARLDAAGRQEVFQSVKEQYAAYLESLGV